MNSKYLKLLFIYAFCISISIVAINYSLDPLSMIKPNHSGFYSSERNLKFAALSLKKFDGLIMGSSKPAHIDPTDLTNDGTIYNASFSAALPEEIKQFIIEIENKPKWIAVGIDWYMFDEKKFPYTQNPTFIKNSQEKLGYLASHDTLLLSLRSILKLAIGSDPAYPEYGARNKRKRELNEESYSKLSRQKTLNVISKRFNEFSISQKRLNDLVEIEKISKLESIDLIFFINPINQEVWDLMMNVSNKSVVQLKESLDIIGIKYVDLSATCPMDECFWKNDPYHYKPSVGANFFRTKLLGKVRNAQDVDRDK